MNEKGYTEEQIIKATKQYEAGTSRKHLPSVE